MKNALGKSESLKIYNDKGDLVYKFYKSFNGYWYECKFDNNGNELIYEDSFGDCYERTYDDNGNELTFKDSEGFWSESTYDNKGNELTYEDSKGTLRGFDIPEYTMEELTKIVGKEFKIKK